MRPEQSVGPMGISAYMDSARTRFEIVSAAKFDQGSIIIGVSIFRAIIIVLNNFVYVARKGNSIAYQKSHED